MPHDTASTKICPRNAHEASLEDVKMSTASHIDAMDRVNPVPSNMRGKLSRTFLSSAVARAVSYHRIVTTMNA
jgi:hypothetical protein